MTRKKVVKRCIELGKYDMYVEDFLSSRNSEKTKITYRRFWSTVAKFTCEESGSHMLETSEQWSKKIMVLKQNLVKDGYSLSTAQSITGMLRGYFSYHKKRLDLSPQDVRVLNQKARNTIDYLYSKEDLRLMYNVAYPIDRLALLIGTNLGLRSEDAVQLTYGIFRSCIEKSEREQLSFPYFLGVIETQKERGVTATCFITKELVETFKAVDDKTHADTDRIFNVRPIQLSETMKRLFTKAGLVTHNKEVVKYHSLRKYLFSSLCKVMSEGYSKLIIGKAVDAATKAYLNDTPENLKGLYSKAMNDILLTNGTAKIVEHVNSLEEENLALKARIKELEKQQGTATSTTAKNEQRIDELYTMIKELQEKK
jgi:hypothetical protein